MSTTPSPAPFGVGIRRASRRAIVRWGERRVAVGGEAPVVVQSMTNTDTADAIATAIQVKASRRPARNWSASP